MNDFRAPDLPAPPGARAWRGHEGWLSRVLGLALALALGVLSPDVQAHKASDAYLNVNRQGDLLALRWDVALRDLDGVLQLDANDDGKLSWGEVRTRRADIEAHLMGRLGVSSADSAKACTLRPTSAEAPLERRNDGTYFVFKATTACPTGRSPDLSISYRFMAELDPTHRGLMQVGGMPGKVWSLAPGAQAVRVPVPDEGRSVSHLDGLRPVAYTPDLMPPAAVTSPESAPARSTGFIDMVVEGVHHILIGTDHVIFVLCLLLPAVLRRPPGSTRFLTPVDSWREAFLPVLYIVTTFTVAHSITLTLAAMGWVSLPSRLIESAIALTIVLAAIDNLWPLLGRRRYLFTFLFGLVHGFGFANVLAELALPAEGFVKALLGFNLGVELGQLMIVVPAMVILMAWRERPVYARWLLPAGSVMAMAVGAGWFIERALDLGFMPL